MQEEGKREAVDRAVRELLTRDTAYRTELGRQVELLCPPSLCRSVMQGEARRARASQAREARERSRAERAGEQGRVEAEQAASLNIAGELDRIL